MLGDVVGVNLVNTGMPDQPMRVADIDYDAYGAPTFSNAGGQGLLAALYVAVAPILYRGYLGISVGGVYCYYLGSRFYSPELGRFLNADVYPDTQQGVVGTNMFAYCNNNPVMMVDPEGTNSLENTLNIFINTFKRIINLLTSPLSLLSVSKTSVSLKSGEKKTVSGKNIVFTCPIFGVADINITASRNVKIRITGKNNRKTTELYNASTYRVNSYFYVPYAKSETKYSVEISSPVTASISCQILVHTDTTTNAKGGKWLPKKDTAAQTPDIDILQKWYFSKEDVANAVAYITSDKYLKYQSDIINMSVKVSIIAADLLITKGLSSSVQEISKAIIYVVEMTSIAANCMVIDIITASLNLRDEVIDSINNASGADANGLNYRYGIVLTTNYMRVPLGYPSNGYVPYVYYNVDRWNSTVMKGGIGMVGDFSFAS